MWATLTTIKYSSYITPPLQYKLLPPQVVHFFHHRSFQHTLLNIKRIPSTLSVFL